MRGGGRVERAATCVFPSDRVVASLEPRTRSPPSVRSAPPTSRASSRLGGTLRGDGRAETGRVAVVARGGATVDALGASLEHGFKTCVTGNAATTCRLHRVQEWVRAFRRRAEKASASLLDAMGS